MILQSLATTKSFTLRRQANPRGLSVRFIYSSTSSCLFDTPHSMRLSSGLCWNGRINRFGEHFSWPFDVNSETMTTRQIPPKPHGAFGKKSRHFGCCANLKIHDFIYYCTTFLFTITIPEEKENNRKTREWQRGSNPASLSRTTSHT